MIYLKERKDDDLIKQITDDKQELTEKQTLKEKIMRRNPCYWPDVLQTPYVDQSQYKHTIHKN